ESQIDAIHQPVCQLRSGGYIVINQTEALVAIDVNSGRATRERHIEETALKTNLEAADEIARQLRLRDLAGLIVIDFIDMDEHRHNHAVERRFKDAMQFDRARIQIGRISPFGLLELSRQRLRPSLVEASTDLCPHCSGTGRIRSIDSSGLHVLRAIEDEALRGKASEIAVYVSTAIALYILNQKRPALNDIEQRYAIRVMLERDDALIPPAFRIDRLRQRQPGEQLPQLEARRGMSNIDTEAEAAADAAAEAAAHALDQGGPPAGEVPDHPDVERDGAPESAHVEQAGRQHRQDEGGGRRRRRRGRRGGEHEDGRSFEADRQAGPGASGQDRFANALEQRPPQQFSRRPLPTPAEFEVGEAGMYGRPGFDQPIEGDNGNNAQPEAPRNDRYPDGDRESRRRRRRGRRGGRRRRRDENGEGTPGPDFGGDSPAATSIVPPAALDMEQPTVKDWSQPSWSTTERPSVEPGRDDQPRYGDTAASAEERPARFGYGETTPSVTSSPAPIPDRPTSSAPVVPASSTAPAADLPPPQPGPKPEPVLQGDLLGDPTTRTRKGWWRRGGDS
ncbi:MAG: ribonuclease E/G, partial [Alphaproteobacteria bacterium]|nr:ribonuclease E/G [Alphaproteobacteria bacterium]